MNNNLLIIGAGIYSVVAYEIAKDMGCFGKIDFVDDYSSMTPNGIAVIGKIADIQKLAADYINVVVAIGNPNIRLSLIEKIKTETDCRIVSLVSPRAYISESAKISDGCIVEPMTVVHSCCELGEGCLISAGAVVNHAAVCGDGVHVDCNATVEGYAIVPAGTKVCYGDVFRKEKYPN